MRAAVSIARTHNTANVVGEFYAAIAVAVDAAAAALMVLGALGAAIKFVRSLFLQESARLMQTQKLRCEFGISLTFALELMIVSDLLHTLIDHSLDDLYALALLVGIRTVITFFLNKEIGELAGEMRADHAS